ncbi:MULTISPECIES: hypothetical protein [Bradyrhizobium]|jgi:hypothetical protein|nr:MULTISPECIES: hypothetical protein [Bradyrhizobium]
MVDLIGRLLNTLVEVFVEATGRAVLKLFGARRPHELACLVTGLVFWTFVGILLLAIVRVLAR